jgi:hypothetical protein
VTLYKVIPLQRSYNYKYIFLKADQADLIENKIHGNKKEEEILVGHHKLFYRFFEKQRDCGSHANLII